MFYRLVTLPRIGGMGLKNRYIPIDRKVYKFATKGIYLFNGRYIPIGRALRCIASGQYRGSTAARQYTSPEPIGLHKNKERVSECRA